MNREGGGTRRLALGLVLAVLLTVGGGVVLSRWADEGTRGETVAATGQPVAGAVTTTSAPAAVAAPPTTTAASAPPTTAPDRPSTTRAATAVTPTTARTASVPATTTTTTPAGAAAAGAAADPGDGPPGPACVSTMFDTHLSLERTTYRPGETVRGTATFTNVSGNTCYWASTTGSMDVLDGSGRSLTPPATVIRDGFDWVPFTPGEVFTQTPAWDQQACPPSGLPVPCGQAPPGTYTMVATERPYGSARATFQLVSG